MLRRQLLASLISLTALTAGLAVQADTWPSKPIRVVVPFGAGSAADIVPRVVMEQVGKQLGQTIVVENRAGAGSTTGTAAVAKADADGYTLLATSSALAVTPSLFKNLPYDPRKDLVPIASFGLLPTVLIVPASTPHKTLADFVAAAKAKPGSLNFASVGVGSATFMAAERFRIAAGYEAAHVAFKSGSEALTEVVAGRIDYYMCPVNTALPLIRDGKLKALAVSTPTRVAALPDVPTTLEAGFAESEYSSWVGLLAPAGTPTAIVDRLHKEVTAALAVPDVAAKLGPNGIEPMPVTPAAFAAYIDKEITLNAGLVAAVKLKAN